MPAAYSYDLRKKAMEVLGSVDKKYEKREKDGSLA